MTYAFAPSDPPILTIASTPCAICDEPAERGQLCTRHHHDIALALEEIPDLLATLTTTYADHQPDHNDKQNPRDHLDAKGHWPNGDEPIYGVPRKAAGDSNGGTPKRPEAPVPIDLQILAVTDSRNSAVVTPDDVPDVPGVIAEWAAQILTTRGMIGDITADRRPLNRNCNTIRNNLRWCSERDWIADMHQELVECHTALRRAAGPHGNPREEPLGLCPVVLPLATCATPLYAEDSGAVRCPNCRVAWTTPQQLARLNLMLERHG